MKLALEDIWVEKRHSDFFVRIRDGQVCNALGPLDERSAHKIHAHLIEAVFSACLEQVERSQGQQMRQAAGALSWIAQEHAPGHQHTQDHP